MPFTTAPKSNATATNSNGPGGGGRTTFRPPWVKDDGGVNQLKSVTKTSVPWAKKTASIDKDNATVIADNNNSSNGTKSGTKAPAKTTATPTTTTSIKKGTENAAATKKSPAEMASNGNKKMNETTIANKDNNAKPKVSAFGAKKVEPTPTPPPPTTTTTKTTATTRKTRETTPPKKVSVPIKKIEPVNNRFAPAAKKLNESTAQPPPPASSVNRKVVVPAKPEVKRATPTSMASKKKEPSSSEEEEESSSEEEETEEEESEEEESDEEEEDEDEDDESEEDESEEESEDTPTPPPPPPTKQNVKQPLSKLNAPKVTNNNTTTLPQLKGKTPAVSAPAPVEEESELKRRFSLEKPKLRPVVVKSKSKKKIENDNKNYDDDDEAVEGETEEERERRLRFKLEKPKLRHVKREEKPLPNKSTDNMLKIRPALKKVPKIDDVLKEVKEEPKPEFKTKTLRKTPSIRRDSSIKNVPAPPPLPSLVPKAPPPPPPPGGLSGKKAELTENQKKTIEKLKQRPRRRPDWSEMMAEVESGKKLRHVECNDRSQPILTCKSMTKVDDKFIYETEKDASHNKLLKQIQGGIRLKPTKTNDRSKPFLEGLRKFRRQMTIEEQLQKSQSKINLLAAGMAEENGVVTGSLTIAAALSMDDPSGDELDDIDTIRDDLQSTKQMLALELRNREAKERENKKLLIKIATLEAELAREKSREKNLEYGANVIIATMDASPASEEAYVNSLKQDAEEARRTTKDLEKKYLSTGELLDQAKSEIEEQKRQIQMLERKLAAALQGDDLTPNSTLPQFEFTYCYDDPDDQYISFATNHHQNGLNNGYKGGSLNGSRRPSDALAGRDSSPELDVELSESDPDEPEEKKTERREKRIGKEVKMLRNKLTKVKVKHEAAKKEKLALKQAMKKNHVILKEENKKFKKLEKEVQKMAASMKEDYDDDEDETDKNDDEEEAKASEESEEEDSDESDDSESEESEAGTESESEGEDASNSDKKKNLEPRVKKHEGRMTAMKKCNVLLQANVDNLQDEITQVRAKAASLQAELDAVLQDLGF